MESSIDEKVRLIYVIQEIDTDGYIGRPTALLIHAVLNTIGILDLIKIHIDFGFANSFIKSNIFKRLSEESKILEVYDYVFEVLKDSNYRDRLHLRAIMEAAMDEVDETRKLEFFTYFYNSKYVHEFNASLKIAKMVWNDHIESLLVGRFQKTNNIKILLLLLDYLKDELLPELIKSVWKVDTPNWIKARFVNKLKGLSLNEILFLKDIDPSNFLVLLRYCGSDLSNEVLADCYNNTPDKYKPFAIWNLGKLKKWDVIKPYIEKYIDNPNEVYVDFSDVRFE